MRIEGRDDVREDVEGRALAEGPVDVPEERLGQVGIAEAVEDEPVERHEALEGGLLAGLERPLLLPFPPGRPEGRLERRRPWP